MKKVFFTLAAVAMFSLASTAQNKEEKAKNHEKARKEAQVNTDGTLRPHEDAQPSSKKEEHKGEAKKTKAAVTPSTTATEAKKDGQ
jgi:Ni/Co efflux regulator RcnB